MLGMEEMMTPLSQSRAGNSLAMVDPVPLVGKRLLVMARMIFPKKPPAMRVADSNPAEYTNTEDHNSSDVGDIFIVSEEGEAFLETVFTSKLKYATRQAKIAKYGQPDSKHTKCPALGSVVEGILSNEAFK